MKLPKRADQHIAESESRTILARHMPREWIIRETTERDYGVDLYVELVGRGQRLSGDLVALQVKAVKKIKVTDGHFTVGRIKRETLNYWLLLPVPVFLVATCLSSKAIFWANIRELHREGRFDGDSKFVSARLSSSSNFSKSDLAAFGLSYYREKRWGDIENAIEKSLMLFNSLGPLVLLCRRGKDDTTCTTTIQYLINQHYEYYELLFRYLNGGKPKPLPNWYSENVTYIKSEHLAPSLTLYHHTLKEMLKAFVPRYRDCILAAYELVTDRQSGYFSKRLPFLHMHLVARPHTFIADDWFARFFYDEYERETQNPARLYFANFTEFDEVLASIQRT